MRKYFLYFFVKTIGFNIFSLAAFWINVSRSSHLIATHPYSLFFMAMPLIALRIFENISYSGTLTVDFIFKLLNQRLLEIIPIGKTDKIKEKTSHRSIETYCQLSDELDKLSMLHSKLSETTESLNSVFSFQLVIWITLHLVQLIIRCFFQYVTIVHLLNNSELESVSSMVKQNLQTFGLLLLTWAEIVMTSYACESLANEVSVMVILKELQIFFAQVL